MEKLLTNIHTPADLRQLEIRHLPQLARELREVIIRDTAANGGHLASNLGAVELTVALHYVLNTPQDKLVWDVGHQCYAHKLLTGRQEGMRRLRQEDGVSGFCNREESEYDCFTTGHSSNSLSLALGLAQAQKLDQGSRHIAAVIGDGALTGGMAYEALNNIGGSQARMLVILNDNGMSIGGNVGGLARYLATIRAGAKYNRLKRRVTAGLNSIPYVGPALLRFGRGFKHTLKSVMLTPGMFFENLGFVYLGPIDGHDIPALIEILRRAVDMNKPVLLHVKTVKGKGYTPAESDPAFYHGVGSFDISTGLTLGAKGVSYTDVFADALLDMAALDERVVAITAAMAQGTGLDRFAERWPERFFDVGIAEQHAVSFAAGLAAGGKKPVVAIYSCFLQRAYDQLIEDVCLQGLPVVFAIDRAGLVGQDGASHQGVFDLSYLSAIPGLTVMAPADGRELRAMLQAALASAGPVALRYPRCLARNLPNLPAPIHQGRAVLLRPGQDAALFALGSAVQPALAAAAVLAEQGIQARVLNARFAAPLDEEALLQAARDCRGRVVVLAENVNEGGFGAACAAALSRLPASPRLLGLPLRFIGQGQRDAQLGALGLDSAGIVTAVTAMVSEKLP